MSAQTRKDIINKYSNILPSETEHQIYHLILKYVEINLPNTIKMEFGNPNKATTVPEKIVMVLGATGSGKTTIINSMVNYIFGVELEDDFRVKLIHEAAEEGTPASQAFSQTSKITAYTLHHQPWFKIPYTLTIVDTPGFGDTAGIARDKEIKDTIDKFFRTEGSSGLDHISTIGFVVRSSQVRLDATQKYIFDSILSLFGKDIEENIAPLFTFADGQIPKALEAVKEGEIPHAKYFTFNNSCVFKKVDRRIRLDWEDSMGSYEKMFEAIEAMPNKSLSLTKQVLRERENLQTQVQGLNESIGGGMLKLEKLDKEEEVMKANDRNATETVNEPIYVKVDTPNGKHALNCKICNETCLFPCSYYLPIRLSSAMSWDGECTVCEGNCPSKEHQKQTSRYVWTTEKVTKTKNDIKKRYQNYEGEMLSDEQVLERLRKDVADTYKDVITKSANAKYCVERLQKIALKPNPMSTVNYIDLLIEQVQNENKPGALQKISKLKEVRKTAEILEKIASGNDPIEELIEKVQEIYFKQEQTDKCQIM